MNTKLKVALIYVGVSAAVIVPMTAISVIRRRKETPYTSGWTPATNDMLNIDPDLMKWAEAYKITDLK